MHKYTLMHIFCKHIYIYILCMLVCIHVFMRAYMYTYGPMRVYSYVYICIVKCICRCIYLHIWNLFYTFKFTSGSCVSARMGLSTYICLYIEAFLAFSILYMYTYIMSAHIHTYTYIHTRIQNVHMNARKARLKRWRRSDCAGSPA